jgi:2-polyprenyl-6-hydroxyphenyl methylase/3-demethylubiquinone-9 3-methyltransferase
VQYDVVLNMEVVEHVDNLADFMASCASLTRPGGLMIVATINRTLYSLITAKLGAEYILGWLPKGTHSWHRFVTPDKCFSMLRESGFGLREVTGVGVNPLRKSLHLTRYLGGNYMLVAVRRETHRA